MSPCYKLKRRRGLLGRVEKLLKFFIQVLRNVSTFTLALSPKFQKMRCFQYDKSWKNEAFCWQGEYDEAANYKTLFGTRMMVLDFFIPEGL